MLSLLRRPTSAGNTSAVSPIYDPIIGGTTIEANGGISLIQVGNHYYLDDSTGAVPPSLKFSAADYVAGHVWLPRWRRSARRRRRADMRWPGRSRAPISIRCGPPTITAITSRISALLSGTSTALESLESSFHQDLNGDGQIGVVPTVIEANGATSLTQVGDHFYLYDSTGAGPSLKFRRRLLWRAWLA